MDRRIITLITDFGSKDGYVGTMKGVILTINPQVSLIDITHEVSPQDIFEAGFVLQNSYKFFPRHSIHLVVVDPGVGGERKALLIDTEDHLFIGPDNGVFTLIYECENINRIIELTKSNFFLPDKSSTFHGRDIFAPVAAHLSRGISVEDFGDVCNEIVTIDIPKPEITEGAITGVVLHIDNFGNLITNISEGLFRALIGEGSYKIMAGNKVTVGLKVSYSEVKKGEVLAIFGSAGYLEISAREQNAQKKLKMNKGSEIKVIY